MASEALTQALAGDDRPALAAPHTTTSPGPRVLRVDAGIKHITKETAA